MIRLPKNLVKETIVGKSPVRYGDIPCTSPLRDDTAIFFVAGQKSPLERFFPFSEYFAQYYHTYNYEIPGMGVAKRSPDAPPLIQNFADEIREFLETRIAEPNIIVFAGSVGFWFTTQAILDSPILQQRVKKVVALFGVLGKETFGFSPLRKLLLLNLCRVMSTRPAATLTNWLLKHDWVINPYSKHLIRNRHLSHLDEHTQMEYEEFEKFLLRIGDWQIHFSTAAQYLTSDMDVKTKLNIPLLALYTKNDQFFPLKKQQLTFPRVYKEIKWLEVESKRHAPLIVRNWREYRERIPELEILNFLSVTS